MRRTRIKEIVPMPLIVYFSSRLSLFHHILVYLINYKQSLRLNVSLNHNPVFNKRNRFKLCDTTVSLRCTIYDVIYF